MYVTHHVTFVIRQTSIGNRLSGQTGLFRLFGLSGAKALNVSALSTQHSALRPGQNHLLPFTFHLLPFTL